MAPTWDVPVLLFNYFNYLTFCFIKYFLPGGLIIISDPVSVMNSFFIIFILTLAV